MASEIKPEEVFQNACHNATLSYSLWERNPEEHNLNRLLCEAQEVIDAAVVLLRHHGVGVEMAMDSPEVLALIEAVRDIKVLEAIPRAAKKRQDILLKEAAQRKAAEPGTG